MARRESPFGLPDAQLVVARLYGFDDWDGFVASSRRSEPAPAGDGVPLSSTPPFYSIDRARGTIEPRQPMSDRDSDVLIAIVEDRQLTGINARQQMSDSVLARIASLDRITRLDLDGCTRVTDAGLAYLERMPQLEELSLSGWHSPITDRGLAVLRHLKKLRRFDMAWPQRVTDAGMANLEDCIDLESVNLMGTRTGDGAIRALAEKPRLRRLFAGTTVTDAGLALLKHVPRFTSWSGEAPEYSLMGFDAGPTYLGIDGPFSAPGLRALERLQFHDCRRITNAGMRHLAALPSLREVTLEYNRNITRTGASVFPPRVRVKYEAR